MNYIDTILQAAGIRYETGSQPDYITDYTNVTGTTKPDDNATRTHVFSQDEPPTNPTDNIQIRDVWYDTNDGNKISVWNGTGWDDFQDAGIAQALLDAYDAQSTADGKIVTFYQDSPPSGLGESDGDLWFDTNDGNKIYRYVTNIWTEIQDDGIATAISDAATAQSTADGKIVTFFTTTEPTTQELGDLWYNSTTNLFKRWNGTTWDDTANGYTLTSELTDDDDLGLTAVWSSVTGTDLPADNATNSKVFRQSATPTVDLNEGDLWVNTSSTPYVTYRFSGVNWADVVANNITDTIEINDTANLGGTADYSTVNDDLGTMPDDNATVGATWSTDITNQPSDTDLLNTNTEWSDVSGTTNAPTDNATVNHTYYQDAEPVGAEIVDGDTWYDTNDNNKIYIREVGVWVDRTHITSGGTTTYTQPSVPTGMTSGDIWFDTDNGYLMKFYDGASWLDYTVEDANNSLDLVGVSGSSVVSDAQNGATFTSSSIYAGTITATQVNAAGISATNITGGTMSASISIISDGYIQANGNAYSGKTINFDGSNANAYGALYGESGNGSTTSNVYGGILGINDYAGTSTSLNAFAIVGYADHRTAGYAVGVIGMTYSGIGVGVNGQGESGGYGVTGISSGTGTGTSGRSLSSGEGVVGQSSTGNAGRFFNAYGTTYLCKAGSPYYGLYTTNGAYIGGDLEVAGSFNLTNLEIGGTLTLDNGTNDTPQILWQDTTPTTTSKAFMDMAAEKLRIFTYYRSTTVEFPLELNLDTLVWKGSNMNVCQSGHDEIGATGLFMYTYNASREPGYQVAGSNLKWACFTTTDIYTYASSPSGTWRLLGYHTQSFSGRASVWQRIL